MTNYNPSQIRCLIIDDNILNIHMIKKCLSTAGYGEIITTTNPKEAADLYQTKKPHIVLLDLNMPGFDGFAVLKQLQTISNGQYLPVIVLSAEEDKDIRVKALESGAKDIVLKPFETQEILARIKNVVTTGIALNKN